MQTELHKILSMHRHFDVASPWSHEATDLHVCFSDTIASLAFNDCQLMRRGAARGDDAYAQRNKESRRQQWSGFRYFFSPRWHHGMARMAVSESRQYKIHVSTPPEGLAAPSPWWWCLLGHLCFLCGFWLVTHHSDSSYLCFRGVTLWPTQSCITPNLMHQHEAQCLMWGALGGHFCRRWPWLWGCFVASRCTNHFFRLNHGIVGIARELLSQAWWSSCCSNPETQRNKRKEETWEINIESLLSDVKISKK